ncbi:DUF2470 domain-containing protein [Micromonospora craniellae]|uniref:DUF2470 domain-containing protein n=1 Tax=Micromonospora craniellae TaxID=2294034 RepID=UPI001CC7EDC4|nr:DUF2470 domain-containing protein [Micromonospora craniellae]
MSKAPLAATTATPAERLRTLLAGADSLRLRTTRHRADLIGRHTLDADGQLRVALPAHAELARHLLDTGEAPALVEITDLAPIPGRHRVRSRATLTGWLTLDDLDGGDVTAVLALATADLVDADGDAAVDPDDLAAADPDPLGPYEADLLRHLHDAHPEALGGLARLVPADRRAGAGRVHPLRLDRHGIVLRLEVPEGHRDVRLAFAEPLAGPDDVGAGLARLLGVEPGCPSCVHPHPHP